MNYSTRFRETLSQIPKISSGMYTTLAAAMLVALTTSPHDITPSSQIDSGQLRASSVAIQMPRNSTCQQSVRDVRMDVYEIIGRTIANRWRAEDLERREFEQNLDEKAGKKGRTATEQVEWEQRDELRQALEQTHYRIVRRQIWEAQRRHPKA